MTIHLDTSALVGAPCGPRRSLPRLMHLVDQGCRVMLSSIVLYEWLRGSRTPVELRAREDLFPRAAAVPFDSEAAAEAARLYTQLRRTRGRDVDLAIAASALVHGASLWTLNDEDFRDVPGLTVM